jgi:SAM-dependent methyltransferase
VNPTSPCSGRRFTPPLMRSVRPFERRQSERGLLEMTQRSVVDRPSLEQLVETGMLTLESLHPGGLETTAQLARLCGIQRGADVLDVASGTGETACFLAEDFGARVLGVDSSDQMIRRAETKARARDLDVAFRNADAADLPFSDATFDAAICECTLCLLDKPRVLGAMARVVRPGGSVGMHDLYWKDGAAHGLKRTLAEIEGEKPETLDGWRRLFESAGLVQVIAVDRSEAKSRWMQESRRQLGWTGQLTLFLKIVRRWGVRGVWRVLRSERVFSNDRLGYVLVVGRKQWEPGSSTAVHDQPRAVRPNGSQRTALPRRR